MDSKNPISQKNAFDNRIEKVPALKREFVNNSVIGGLYQTLNNYNFDKNAVKKSMAPLFASIDHSNSFKDKKGITKATERLLNIKNEK